MRRWATPLAAVGAVLAALAAEGWLLQHQFRLALYFGLAGLLGLLIASAVAFWRGRRRWAAALLAVVLILGTATGGYTWSLTRKLNQISTIKAPAGFDSGRPSAESGKAMNLLLLGADNPDPSPDKPTVAELLRDGTWQAGAYRSDSIMLVHIPADRRRATIVSIPRDSYVTIVDDRGTRHELNKINAAFDRYGPFGTVRTVEALTGIRIQHLAIIDFEGFRDLTTALGGVDVYVPDPVYDPELKQNWPQGWNHIEGALALRYVRMRYGLAEGDFGRAARQQNFLRALLAKLTDDGTLGNPVRLQNTVEAAAPYLTVDDSWAISDMLDLGLGPHRVHTDKLNYVTLGLLRYATIDGVGSVNLLDEKKNRELWSALRSGQVGAYLKRYPEDALGDSRHVS